MPFRAASPPLGFRDVFVLTTWDRSVSTADGLVLGLDMGGVPVTLLQRGDAAGVEAVVKMTGADQAVVAGHDDVSGLERKIVVWVEADKPRSGGGQRYDEEWGRLKAMSRCTAQLVCVMNTENTS